VVWLHLQNGFIRTLYFQVVVHNLHPNLYQLSNGVVLHRELLPEILSLQRSLDHQFLVLAKVFVDRKGRIDIESLLLPLKLALPGLLEDQDPQELERLLLEPILQLRLELHQLEERLVELVHHLHVHEQLQGGDAASVEVVLDVPEDELQDDLVAELLVLDEVLNVAAQLIIIEAIIIRVLGILLLNFYEG